MGGIVSLNFFLPRFMPGDPVTAMLGDGSYLSAEDIAAVTALYGLDRPLFLQYLGYWKSILLLDFGTSIRLHAPVLSIILPRLFWTALIIIPSIVISSLAGIRLGGSAGQRHPCLPDTIFGGLLTPFYAAPPFFTAMVLLYIFSFKLGWFPLGGFYSRGGLWDTAFHLALPIATLSLSGLARNYLMMRGSVLQERTKLYACFARAKGLNSRQVLRRHIYPNALLPLITLIALDAGFSVSGAMFVEIIFSLNGMGTLLFDALTGRDYPLIQGIFLILMMTVLCFNIIADIIYLQIDPRLREAK